MIDDNNHSPPVMMTLFHVESLKGLKSINADSADQSSPCSSVGQPELSAVAGLLGVERVEPPGQHLCSSSHHQPSLTPRLLLQDLSKPSPRRLFRPFVDRLDNPARARGAEVNRFDFTPVKLFHCPTVDRLHSNPLLDKKPNLDKDVKLQMIRVMLSCYSLRTQLKHEEFDEQTLLRKSWST